jgi:NADPH2:quinone reductase
MFGKASGDPPPLDPFLLAPKSLYVTWPIRPVYTEHHAQLEAAAADLFDAIQRGILDVGPSRTYGLDDIVTAHHYLEGRRMHRCRHHHSVSAGRLSWGRRNCSFRRAARFA